MSLSRKHFNALAGAIYDMPENDTKFELAESIGQVCRQFNANFKWGEWLKACGFDMNGAPLRRE